ncbi:hypothetical protein INT45_000223 [Circinella minor]|uniref:Uncharacterized protein n=1 Tax=Circinella minor TaxID=1195481 RepID=A0A8H7S348_9FUNG|nr:hypothetical protein INT45_000223 [Circinella minor]
MSFPQFPNGDFEKQIPLRENAKVVRPTSNDKRAKVQVALPSTFFQVHSLEHVTCSVTVNFKIYGSLGHFKHKGIHSHGAFEALHDTKEILDKVEECVLKCPSETAYAFKIVTSVVTILLKQYVNGAGISELETTTVTTRYNDIRSSGDGTSSNSNECLSSASSNHNNNNTLATTGTASATYNNNNNHSATHSPTNTNNIKNASANSLSSSSFNPE